MIGGDVLAIVSIQVSGTVEYNRIPVSASFTSGGGLAAYYRFFRNGVGASSLESFSSPVSSATKYYTYTGLQGNTSYSLTVHFYNSSMNTLGSDSITIRTPSEPDRTPPSINSWYANSINKKSVEMYVSASDNSGVSGFYFYQNGSYVTTMYGSSGRYTFSGLSPGTTYSFGVKAFDIYNNTSSTVNYSATTLSNSAPTIISWYATQIGANSVTMYVASSDDEYVSGYWFYLNGSSVSPTSDGNGRYTFNNLLPNTVYSLGVKAYDGDGAQSSMSSYSVTTKKNRPANFEWDNGKYSGYAFNISASEWNRLCGRINEFRSYKGLSDSIFTTVSKGVDFKAAYYNELVNAIKGMSPPTSVPNNRVAGDFIYANDINRLKESLNSIL
ncbi:Chitinase A1 precursor [compost metagenome]